MEIMKTASLRAQTLWVRWTKLIAAVAVLSALALMAVCVPASAHLEVAKAAMGHAMGSVTPPDSASRVDHASDVGTTAASSTAVAPATPGLAMCENACLTDTVYECTAAGTTSPGIPRTALEPRLTFVYLVPRLTQTGAQLPVVKRFPPPPTLSALCLLRV